MTQPERPIEKQLHAAARERRGRAGGPFELHPATRRLLQGEVARQYGAGKSTPTLWFRWVQVWPRLAWSLGTFLVLGVAAWITWQSNQPARLERSYAADRSRSTNQIAKETAAVPLALPASPSRETEAAKRKMVREPAQPADAFAERRYAVPSPAPLSKPAPATSKNEPSVLAAAAPPATSSRQKDSAPPAAPLGISSLPESSVASQAFLFSNRVATPATNTLASFTVEQNGAALKMVDADGSIYTGQVLVAEVELAPTARLLQSRKDAAVGDSAAAAPRLRAQSQVMNQNQLNFRVAGTNRSLNQNVVFTGSFVPVNEAAISQVVSNVTALQNNRAGNQGALRNQQQSQQQVPWNNGRISGQAVLGNKQTIAVEASPSPQK